MIPGLDYLITRRIAEIGGTASQAKLQILEEANAAWIARGRPHQTMNARIWLSLSAPAGPTYTDLVLASNPAAYWPLDDPSGTVARDAAGTRNGTISGGVTLNQPGVAGSKCMVFANDGSGKIVLPSFPSLGAPFTLEAWVTRSVNKGPTPSGLMVRTIFSDGDFQWAVPAGNTQLQLYYFNQAPQTSVSPVLALGTLYHVVLTANTQVTVYVNGVPGASTPISLGGNGAGPPALGSFAEAGAEAYGWPGALQDLAVYTHVLTPIQIRAHYSARVPGQFVRSITAGQPGTFSPATAPIPTFPELQAMTPPWVSIAPLGPWPVADWIVAAGGELCSWTGSQWVVKP